VAQMSEGQVGESSMRRSCRLSGWISGQAPGTAFGSSRQADSCKGGARGLQMGSAELGIGRRLGSSVRAGFRPGDCQVGPKVGLGVFAAFLARFCGEVGPWIRVLDWSKVCFFGSMRCHGHMASCVPAHLHVTCCGSHWAHMMSCAYLSHPGSDVCK
jgi:hypothetical protein